jgi:hypothetical protein
MRLNAKCVDCGQEYQVELPLLKAYSADFSDYQCECGGELKIITDPVFNWKSKESIIFHTGTFLVILLSGLITLLLMYFWDIF